MTTRDDPERGFATRCLHAGYEPEAAFHSLNPPIYQTTTFWQPSPNVTKGYTYSRSGNPTVSVLERRLGDLEGAAHPAVCFNTGMAALACLGATLLRAGDRVLIGDVVYGGTVRLFRNTFEKFGVRVDFVDTADAEEVERALRKPTRLVLLETPANPTLKITDIAAVAERAHRANATVAVDNTFLTALYQRPFDLGADVVVYSTTKYIEGHNATTGGALLTHDAALHERFRFDQNALGLILSPFEAWLTLQGLKTLPLRLPRQTQTAHALARWLERDPRVSRVYFPGLLSFPGHRVHQRQATGHGAMLAFELHQGFEAARRLMENVRLVRLAENLGAVESIITHPASMTHAAVPPDARRHAGIADGLVRLSVGIEDPRDLQRDLAHALDQAHAAPGGERLVVAA